MRLIRDGRIHLKKHKGFKPIQIPNDAERMTLNLSGVYPQSSNWTWVMKRDVVQSEPSVSIRACFSGIGTFMWNGPMIIDGTNLQILAIGVKDGMDNYLYMVSDIFDTPKCPRQYKTFRMQWRKAMFEAVNARKKIVKMPHSFIQKFKMEFNYVPDAVERKILSQRIFRDVKNSTRG